MQTLLSQQNSALVVGMVHFVRSDLFGTELCVEAASLLNVVTDDNARVCQLLLSTAGAADVLLKAFDVKKQPLSLYLKTLIGSVLLNMAAAAGSTSKNSSAILSNEFQNTLSTQLMPHFMNVLAASSTSSSTTSDTIQSTTLDLLRAQQLTLEILSTLFLEAGDIEEELAESNKNKQAAAKQAALAQLCRITVPMPTLMSTLLTLCGFNDGKSTANNNAVPNTDAEDDSHSIHVLTTESVPSRALACLSSVLIWKRSAALLSEHDLSGLWRALIGCIASGSTQANLEDGEPLAKCLSALLETQRASSSSSQLLATITPQDLQLVLQLASMASSEVVRSCACGMLAVLGQRAPQPAVLVEIGKCLLARTDDSSVTVLHDALDAIFDVFAEPPVNDIVRQLQMMPKLKAALQRLRAERRSTDDEELNELVEESKENLERFIEYKAEQAVV
jgi:hypothetical protein